MEWLIFHSWVPEKQTPPPPPPRRRGGRALGDEHRLRKLSLILSSRWPVFMKTICQAENPGERRYGSCYLVCALLLFSFFPPPASITRNRPDWRRRAGEGSLRWERQLDRRSWHLGVRQQLFFRPGRNKRRNTLNGRRRPPRTVETGLLRNIWRAIRENESFNEGNNTR